MPAWVLDWEIKHILFYSIDSLHVNLFSLIWTTGASPALQYAISFNILIRNRLLNKLINPLYPENPIMGTFANSEDPDEMQHNAAFHRGFHCLLKFKQPSVTEIHHHLETFTCDP